MSIDRFNNVFKYHFFFFQAEDGIRDKLVTGVQTCALPISVGGRSVQRTDALHLGVVVRVRVEREVEAVGRTAAELRDIVDRSEERRVGKECRSRRMSLN